VKALTIGENRLDALFCGFRAVCVLRGYYPPDLARSFRPFVDLLLTRGLERKKPPCGAAANLLRSFIDLGCGGRI
jgi:hypothetical protein